MGLKMEFAVKHPSVNVRRCYVGEGLVEEFFFRQKTAYEVSACLVGSEMYIRDKCICERQLLGKQDNRRGHPQRNVQRLVYG